eukprot:GHVL01033452.1.p1 GENE.GHVL01033452.1~~GHVL01033452.1.p1  ORF type:complete len:1561 (-),score=239.08 GHVL01033452.1:3575-8257(-)
MTIWTMPGVAITCNSCGGKFFPSSLQFHIKQCLKKQSYVEVPCQYCDDPIRQMDMEAHLKSCQVRKRQANSKERSNSRIDLKSLNNKNFVISSNAGAALKTIRDQGYCKSANQAKIDPNEKGRSQSLGRTGLIPCAVCGRTFQAARLSKHQSICRATASKMSQRKVFDTAQKRKKAIGMDEGEFHPNEYPQESSSNRNEERRGRNESLRAFVTRSRAQREDSFVSSKGDDSEFKSQCWTAEVLVPSTVKRITDVTETLTAQELSAKQATEASRFRLDFSSPASAAQRFMVHNEKSNPCEVSQVDTTRQGFLTGRNARLQNNDHMNDINDSCTYSNKDTALSARSCRSLQRSKSISSIKDPTRLNILRGRCFGDSNKSPQRSIVSCDAKPRQQSDMISNNDSLLMEPPLLPLSQKTNKDTTKERSSSPADIPPPPTTPLEFQVHSGKSKSPEISRHTVYRSMSDSIPREDHYHKVVRDSINEATNDDSTNRRKVIDKMEENDPWNVVEGIDYPAHSDFYVDQSNISSCFSQAEEENIERDLCSSTGRSPVTRQFCAYADNIEENDNFEQTEMLFQKSEEQIAFKKLWMDEAEENIKSNNNCGATNIISSDSISTNTQPITQITAGSDKTMEHQSYLPQLEIFEYDNLNFDTKTFSNKCSISSNPESNMLSKPPWPIPSFSRTALSRKLMSDPIVKHFAAQNESTPFKPSTNGNRTYELGQSIKVHDDSRRSLQLVEDNGNGNNMGPLSGEIRLLDTRIDKYEHQLGFDDPNRQPSLDSPNCVRRSRYLNEERSESREVIGHSCDSPMAASQSSQLSMETSTPRSNSREEHGIESIFPVFSCEDNTTKNNGTSIGAASSTVTKSSKTAASNNDHILDFNHDESRAAVKKAESWFFDFDGPMASEDSVDYSLIEKTIKRTISCGSARDKKQRPILRTLKKQSDPTVATPNKYTARRQMSCGTIRQSNVGAKKQINLMEKKTSQEVQPISVKEYLGRKETKDTNRSMADTIKSARTSLICEYYPHEKETQSRRRSVCDKTSPKHKENRQIMDMNLSYIHESSLGSQIHSVDTPNAAERIQRRKDYDLIIRNSRKSANTPKKEISKNCVNRGPVGFVDRQARAAATAVTEEVKRLNTDRDSLCWLYRDKNSTDCGNISSAVCTLKTHDHISSTHNDVPVVTTCLTSGRKKLFATKEDPHSLIKNHFQTNVVETSPTSQVRGGKRSAEVESAPPISDSRTVENINSVIASQTARERVRSAAPMTFQESSTSRTLRRNWSNRSLSETLQGQPQCFRQTDTHFCGQFAPPPNDRRRSITSYGSELGLESSSPSSCYTEKLTSRQVLETIGMGTEQPSNQHYFPQPAIRKHEALRGNYEGASSNEINLIRHETPNIFQGARQPMQRQQSTPLINQRPQHQNQNFNLSQHNPDRHGEFQSYSCQTPINRSSNVYTCGVAPQPAQGVRSYSRWPSSYQSNPHNTFNPPFNQIHESRHPSRGPCNQRFPEYFDPTGFPLIVNQNNTGNDFRRLSALGPVTTYSGNPQVVHDQKHVGIRNSSGVNKHQSKGVW